MIKRFNLLIFSILFTACVVYSQKRIGIYELYYSQSFDSLSSIQDFEFSDTLLCSLENNSASYALKFSGVKKDTTDSTIYNIGLLSNLLLADFILDFDVKIKDTVNDTNRFAIVFGFKNPQQYYYITLPVDTKKPQFMKIKPDTICKLPLYQKENHKIKSFTWNKIRLERNIIKGQIKIFINQTNTPDMVAVERNYPTGFIGFRTRHQSFYVDNIKIWAPSIVEYDSKFYYKKREINK